jgi:hypothetical protein
MKELDLLLERFAREHYDSAPPERRLAFERLLELPDPLLVELLLGGLPAGAAVSDPSDESCSAVGAAVAGDPELARVAALVAAPGRR